MYNVYAQTWKKCKMGKEIVGNGGEAYKIDLFKNLTVKFWNLKKSRVSKEKLKNAASRK